jgi:NAD-dependent deacetylase
VGTTSSFGYISGPIELARRRGWFSVEINPGQTRVSSVVDVKISLGAAAALDAIWQRYQGV